jgi:hypothetical protein
MVLGALLRCAAISGVMSSSKAGAPDGLWQQRLVPLPDLVLPRPATAGTIRAVRVEGNRVFVLAGVAGPILVLGLDGSVKSRIVDQGRRAEFSPIGFAVTGDTVLVAEANEPGRLLRFKADGSRLAPLSLANSDALAAVDVSGPVLAVTTFRMNRAAPGLLLKIFDRSGRLIREGCAQDSTVQRSIERAGLLAHFQTSAVAIQDSVVWCSQPTLPGPAWSTLGGRSGVDRYLPPFYRAPVDRARERNAKKTVEYLSTWTAHQTVLTRKTIRLSGYSTYLPQAQRFQYWATVCVGPPLRSMCTAEAVAGWPAALDSGLTLYVVPDSQPPGNFRLGRYSVLPR